MTNPTQAIFFHAFNIIGGIGSLRFKKLLQHFKNIRKAWQANFYELEKAGLDKPIIERMKRYQSRINLEREKEKLKAQNINLVSIFDKDYPRLLKEIYDPPYLLYVRGHKDILKMPSIGIVGTRQSSSYGHKATAQIVNDLSSKKFVITSGLARGIDTVAHQTALKSNGLTIAVLGTGVDDKSIYPADNYRLAKKIIEKGALISEFAPGAKPLKYHFPMRNRIISGLSLGIVVMEAPFRSGAMITAQQALEQNREVFAIPGDISKENSQGPHYLLRSGAKLVTCAQDIFEELNF